LVTLELYRNFYPVHTVKDVVTLFQNSLIPTNRSPEFFVDWKKVKIHADELKVELNLWNSLLGSKNIENDFSNLIRNYPEVTKTIPILLAIREREFPVITDFSESQLSLKKMDFNKTRHSTLAPSDIDDYVYFAKKAGLFSLFGYIRNFYDYVLGVEVGLDTNARKNRSGEAMETLLTPLLQEIAKEINCTFLSQKEFRSIQLFGSVPQELANRKSDFILFLENKYVNIETNFFAGSGSKPEEIVDSYINRRNELVKNNWVFVWVTDGDCWRTAGNQIFKAFNNMDYVFNVEFCRKGLLRRALLNIFGKE
jgi:type II restriction enzyme